MPEAAAPKLHSDAQALEAAADQAIAACGGDAREAVKALLIANEFLRARDGRARVARVHSRRETRSIQYLFGLSARHKATICKRFICSGNVP